MRSASYKYASKNDFSKKGDRAVSNAETVRISRHFTNGLEAKSLDLTCEGTFPVS